MEAKAEAPYAWRRGAFDGNNITDKIEIRKMISSHIKNVKENLPKPTFSISRRAFFRFILPWAGLITLTVYSTAKSRFLDRIIDAAERRRL